MNRYAMAPGTQAALIYMQRKLNFKMPEGRWVNGLWHPTPKEDCGVTSTIRPPSQRWPNSYFNACNTLKHCAALCGASHEDAKAALKQLRQRHSDIEIMRMGRGLS